MKKKLVIGLLTGAILLGGAGTLCLCTNGWFPRNETIYGKNASGIIIH